jgi:DNA-binding transcriptional MerR regulator
MSAGSSRLAEDGESAAELSRKELAARLGIGMGALLFYERTGLIPPPKRAANGYRVYTERDAGRLALIVRAKVLGLTLREIGGLLDGIDAGLPKEKLRKGVLKKAEDLQRRIDELEEAKRALLAIAESPNLGNCEAMRAVSSGADQRLTLH